MRVLPHLFAPNPFRLLRDHANETGDCLRQLLAQVEVALKNDRDAVVVQHHKVQSHVLFGQSISEEMSRIVANRACVLPVRRDDVTAATDTLNMMLSGCGEIAAYMSARPLSLPDNIVRQFSTHVCEVIDLSALATDVIAQVDELAEASFGGPVADRIHSQVDEVQARSAGANLRRNEIMRTVCSPESGVCPTEQSFCLEFLTEVARMSSRAGRLSSRFRCWLSVADTQWTPRTREPAVAGA